MFGNLWRVSFLTVAAGLLAAGVAWGQDTLFTDSFEGADGGRPANWRVDGTTGANYWYRDGGRLNTGDGDSHDGTSWAAVTAPNSARWADMRIETDFWMTQTLGQVCLAVRYVDSKNHYAAILKTFRRPGATETMGQQIDIVKVVDGAVRTLASAIDPGAIDLPDFSGKVPPAAGNRFEFLVEGSRLTARLDGKDILSASDGELFMGTVAIGQQQNQVLFDNVRVTKMGGGAATSTAAVTRAPAGASSDGAEAYRLVLLDHAADKSVADTLASDLSAYENVEVVAHGDGTYSVHLGKFATEAEALNVQNSLLSSGFIVYNTIKTGGKAVASGTPSGGTAPADPEFQRMLDEIRRKQEGGTSAPIPTPVAVAATPIPTSVATAPPTDSVTNQIAQLRQAAAEAETRNNLQEAVTHWEAVKNIAQEGPAYDEATTNIRRLNEVLRNEQALQGSDAGGMSPLVLGGIVVGVLLVIGAAAFVVLRGRKKNAELKQKVESIKKAAPAAPAPAAPAKSAQAAEKAPPQAAPASPAGVQEVDSSARIRPGTMMASKEKKVPSSQAPIVPAQAAFTLPTPPPAPPPAPPAAPAHTSAESDGGIKLDFLFEEPAEEASPAADSEAVDLDFDAPQDARKPGKSKEPSTQFIIPPMPDIAPGAPPPTAAPEPDVPTPSSPGDANIFYEQDFEAEEIGAKPANWRGDYEYASLTVVQNPDAPERKCMRFEKKSGVGSAYYSCKFPNASGRIAVEFDIRCDEKNKYLLGFYIERDEDFRQSIHTIVHRTNSSASPTLRIQNEATPYEFGKWSHIKFEIDLPRHIIDGHADGEAIASGVRLNSCPKSINTLSIRDNLATTGVLLIDNIKIYRFR